MTALPTLFLEVDALRDHVARCRDAGRPVVLVPTMGDLHDGHLGLVRIARDIGEVVVSVFVNPAQFAPGEDFERYPRRLESDREKLASVGAGAVFAPSVETMYPPGDATWVTVRGLSEPLCGRHRDGHFRGVTTVCTKLFTIVKPDLAVFGQKDAQQCLVLHRLVRDLHLGVDLVFGPTTRESDGLAMSSRNRYLEGEERTLARKLSEALQAGQDKLEAGARDRHVVEAAMRDRLASPPVSLDYAEMRTVPDLEHRDRAEGRVVLAVAAHVGRARLIDNRCLQVEEASVREAPLLDDHTPQAAAARWRPAG